MSSWCLAISVGIFMATVVCSLNLKNGKKRPTVAYYAFAGGTFVAATTLFIPIYAQQFINDTGQAIKTFLISIHNTMRLFVLDGEFDIIKDFAGNLSEKMSIAFSMYAALLYVLAPLLTFGIVLSFFKNVAAYRRYICGFYKDTYIFSELNEKSLALARSISEDKKRSLFVFTDVFQRNDEQSFELQSRASRLGAICFKQDIVLINWNMHSKKKNLSFFIIGKDEGENITQTKLLLDAYKMRENTSLYLFSSSTEGELAVAHLEKGRMKVRRINEARSIMREALYTNGARFFDTAVQGKDDRKEINAVIIGLNGIGKEMLKGLSWFCQMDGYYVTINAFDSDKNAEDLFRGECPELMSEKINGEKIVGECEYDIKIHSGIIPGSASFGDIFNTIPTPTYVLVSLEDDSENIKQAVFARMLLERRGLKGVIVQAFVRNSQVTSVIKDAKNFKGEAYNIDFIGDVETTYSDAVILKSDLEAKGLRQHMKYPGCREEDFWNYEYNYQSSISLAIHMKMREHCKIPGAGKTEDELNDYERNIIERIEHNRWNAYTRAEGYIYSGSPEKASRNDLGKMHSDLRPFDDLSEATKRLDSFVGTK